MGDSPVTEDTKKLFAEQYMEQLTDDIGGVPDGGEDLFWRAVTWFMEYEEWGQAAFPVDSHSMRDQPWEWVASVQAVKAARDHFKAYMNYSPQEQMQSEEGGIGRGAVGD